MVSFWFPTAVLACYGLQIVVDTVVIANNERYSSQVHNFLVLGSPTFPVSEWIVLGEFNAENRFGEQSFAVTSQAWVRYIKLRYACAALPPPPTEYRCMDTCTASPPPPSIAMCAHEQCTPNRHRVSLAVHRSVPLCA